MPGERNPQSAAEEFAPSPQGESVLDASMMAELIVTKKEIPAQIKKSTGTSWATPKSPGAGGQRLPLAKTHGVGLSIPWFLGLKALFIARLAASIGTLVEEKIGRTRRRGHRSFKAIRKIGGTGIQDVFRLWAQVHLQLAQRVFSVAEEGHSMIGE